MLLVEIDLLLGEAPQIEHPLAQLLDVDLRIGVINYCVHQVRHRNVKTRSLKQMFR